LKRTKVRDPLSPKVGVDWAIYKEAARDMRRAKKAHHLTADRGASGA